MCDLLDSVTSNKRSVRGKRRPNECMRVPSAVRKMKLGAYIYLTYRWVSSRPESVFAIVLHIRHLCSGHIVTTLEARNDPAV